MLSKEQIQKEIEEMDAWIPIYEIEKRLNMPPTTLQKVLKGTRELPKKWNKILEAYFLENKKLEVKIAVPKGHDGKKADLPKVDEAAQLEEPKTDAKKKSLSDLERKDIEFQLKDWGTKKCPSYLTPSDFKILKEKEINILKNKL